jgi:hypothetical protein
MSAFRYPLLALIAPLSLLLVAGFACKGASGPSPDEATETASPEETPVDPLELTGPTRDLAAEPAELTVFGADSKDYAEGVPALAHGDFNQDGLDDVLIGAPFADGPDNSREDAGEAYVVFGREDPPQTLDLASAEGADLTILGGALGDNLGFSVLGADLNADGIDDVIVGAPGTTGVEDPRTDQGEVYVLFGSSELAGTFDIAGESESARITGAEGFSRVGHAIAAGDVNGDGANDLILGAPFAGRHPDTPPGSERTTVGEVYTIFGGPDIAGYTSIITGQQDFAIGGREEQGQFGAAVAVADLNDDGIEDIIAGAPQADPASGLQDAGAAYVFFGRRDLGGRISIADEDQDAIIPGTAATETLGFPMASGDFNADGVDDIAIGARGAGGLGGLQENSGAVYLVTGRGDLPDTIDMTVDFGLPQGAPVIVIRGGLPGALMPSALAAGDLNGDGVDDIVAASSFAGGSTQRTTSGIAYVVLGREAIASLNLATGQQSLAFVGPAADEALGSAATISSTNGDARLVLLASRADRPDGSSPDIGAVYIMEVAFPD